MRENDISVDSYYGWFKRLREEHPEWQDLSNLRAVTQAEPIKNLPETEVIEKPQRRRFTAAYKAKILRETDALSKGQVASLLRREGLYTSHLQKWRLERSVFSPRHFHQRRKH